MMTIAQDWEPMLWEDMDDSLLERVDPFSPGVMASEALDADERAKIEWDYSAVMRSNVAQAVRATGKKSGVFGDVRCTITTTTVERCACHLWYIDACETARAGKPITIVFLDVEKVKLKRVPA